MIRSCGGPLSDLTRKGQPRKVKWGDAQEKVNQTIKIRLTSDPFLRLPDPENTRCFRLRDRYSSDARALG